MQIVIVYIIFILIIVCGPKCVYQQRYSFNLDGCV